jgi:redox-sensitive bicupin YhaK (pirin superfamily)
MPDTRKVSHVLQGQPTVEGAGVHLSRVFGFGEAPRFDPFLLLDDFRSDVPEQYLKGFPWHPHRGIETITYVLDGDVEHGEKSRFFTIRRHICKTSSFCRAFGDLI